MLEYSQSKYIKEIMNGPEFNELTLFIYVYSYEFYVLCKINFQNISEDLSVRGIQHDHENNIHEQLVNFNTY